MCTGIKISLNRIISKFIFFIFISLNDLKAYDNLKKIKSFEEKYGIKAKHRLEYYYKFLDNIKEKSVKGQLKAVNLFFNRYRYKKDIYNWKQNEYWAAPFEFIGVGSGDCEDYAIAKYFTLQKLGIPADKLKVSYAKLFDRRSQKEITHIVLQYFETPESVPVILDNALNRIFPLSKRDDLKVFQSSHIEMQVEAKLNKILSI